MKRRFTTGIALCFAAAVCLASASDSLDEIIQAAEKEANDEAVAAARKARTPVPEERIRLSVSDMRVEYHGSPIGMDEPKPRFSYRVSPVGGAWTVLDPETTPPKHQTARRIVVKEKKSGRQVWDSGWVESGETIQIEYEGEPLKPFTAYTWTVTVKDEKGRISESDETCTGPYYFTSTFETGFLGTPWEAEWIGTEPHSENLQPVPVFRGEAPSVPDAVEARLYITALGLYKPYLNNRDIFEETTTSSLSSGDPVCMTPGWTDYYHRVQYQAYDVTELIGKNTKNVLTIYLAEGWYAGRISRLWSDGNKPTYGDQPLLKAELHIRRADGSVVKLVTGKDWKYKDSRYVMSDIYDGETYDSTIDTAARPFKDAVVFKSEALDRIAIEWNSGEFVRERERLSPKSIRKLDDGTWIVDFGQNFTGRERINLHGNAEKGDVVRVRHAEMLNPDGTLYTDNLRSAKATTTYVSQGHHEIGVYEPQFTFYGFRYLGIEGWPNRLGAETIDFFSRDCVSAEAVYSGLRKTGDFTCSEPLLNKLFQNIVWGQKSNFLDVPTDCPQRDERLGWTADTQVFANAATYNMDAAAFYTKWLRDLNLCQSPEGGYPSFAPDQYQYAAAKDDDFFGYASGWSDAGLIVPWILYTKYGDKRVLELYFDNMVKWLDFQERKSGGTYIIDNAVYGDWLNMDADLSKPFVSTAYFAAMNTLAARIARAIGREADALKREEVFRKTKEAFRARFMDENGELKEKTQTAALFVLDFGLCDEKERKNALEFLVTDITETRKLHLSTGFLGTPLLLRVLTENGQVDLAYKLLLQTSFPSWLYPVTQGATTMWERWDSWNEERGFGDVSMNSFNHYAYGAVADWFYETICGIRPIPDDPAARGFKRFRLEPQPGHELKSASAHYDSAYGRIESGWERRENELVWNFTVPCNTTAEVVFPCPADKVPAHPGLTRTEKGSVFLAKPGKYTFTLPLN
jgi:alpha-L-rhamnosidase